MPDVLTPPNTATTSPAPTPAPTPTPKQRTREELEDFLQLSRERFRLAEEAEHKLREESLNDDEFRAGKHWPKAIYDRRDAEGRPCLSIDKLGQPIRQVTNQERQARPAIQINPVGGGADQATAEIQQGLIRQIEAQSYADVAYDWAFDGAVARGWGYFRVLTQYESDDSFDQVIAIEWIENPYTVYRDPGVRQWNGSDATWCHIVRDLPPAEYDLRYGAGKAAASLAAFTGPGDSREAWFPNGTVRVAEYFYVEEEQAELVQLSTGQTLTLGDRDPTPPGAVIVQRRPVTRRKVRWCLHDATDIKEERDWAGKFIPIIEVEGERLITNGKRTKRGLVRTAIDPQRMYDYWVSEATSATALAPRAPWIMAEGQDAGYETMWANANTVSYSSLKYRAKTTATGETILPPPQRNVAEPPIQAMMAGVQQADRDLRSVTAFFDASDPSRPQSEQSGRAILARRDQGAETNANFMANFSRSLRYLGELLLDLLPKIYDRPGRVVQVLGLDEEVKTVVLGQPFQRGQDGAPQPLSFDDVQRLSEGLTEFYDLSKGRYAVTVTTGASYTTRRQEAVASILELVQAAPNLTPAVADIMVKNMDWPGAPELAARLKKMLPPPLQEGPQGPNPEQLQAQLAALGQQNQLLTQTVEEQTRLLKTDALKQASDERVAAADRDSKERIAVMEEMTKRLIAAEQVEKDTNVAALRASIDELRARLIYAGDREAAAEQQAQALLTASLRPAPAPGGPGGPGDQGPEAPGPGPGGPPGPGTSGLPPPSGPIQPSPALTRGAPLPPGMPGAGG